VCERPISRHTPATSVPRRAAGEFNARDADISEQDRGLSTPLIEFTLVLRTRRERPLSVDCDFRDKSISRLGPGKNTSPATKHKLSQTVPVPRTARSCRTVFAAEIDDRKSPRVKLAAGGHTSVANHDL
jgi:hypothetical protein